MPPSSGKKCGGIGLIIRENKNSRAENAQVWGPSVIVFNTVFHKMERWYESFVASPPPTKRGEARRLVTVALSSRKLFQTFKVVLRA